MGKLWRVGIVKDTSRPMLGSHGLHTAFRGLPDVEVVGHVDANTDDLPFKLGQTLAQRHYRTLDELLEGEALDLVVLCSRHPDDHLPQIRALAERGIHVYCEKPLSNTLPEADAMVALAEQHGIRIGMAHPARRGLAFRTMRRMVAEGAVGTPLTVYGRGKCDHRGGGEDLVVLGTHILDLMTAFFGSPDCVMAEVTAQGRPVAPGERAETVEPIGPAAGDAVFAAFRFRDGVRGVFESRRGLARGGTTPMGITVIGTEGSLTMRFVDVATPAEPQLRISRQSGPPEDGTAYEPVPLTEDRVIPGAEPLDLSLIGQRDVPAARFFLDANRYAVWDLMRAVEEGRQPECSVHDGRLVVEMIQGIYASSLSRRIVDFPLTDRRHPLAAGERG